MNIKELRKRFPAPYALSVLMRALELNPDEPDMETAISEYAEKMKKRPTDYDFFIVMQSGINQLSVGKISAETPKYLPIFRLLATQEKIGNLEQKTIDAIMPLYGEHIKVHPVKQFLLKGSISGFFATGHYISMVGIAISPFVDKEKLTLKDEIIATLAKNALVHYMEYTYQNERRQKEIEYLTKITAGKPDHKLCQRLETLQQAQRKVKPFMEFFLKQPIVFYDSIVQKKYSFLREEGNPIQDYLEKAAKKQAEILVLEQMEITLVQAEVTNLTK